MRVAFYSDKRKVDRADTTTEERIENRGSF